MWRQLFFVLLLTISTLAIKVPVDDKKDITTDTTPVNNADQADYVPIYYASDDKNVDSYLVPPDPHRPEEASFNTDVIATPATYLVPPSAETQTDYFYTPTESDAQSDWYPITQTQNAPVNLLPPRLQQKPDLIPIQLPNDNQSEVFEGIENPKTGQLVEGNRVFVPIPSRRLEPPLENASNDYEILAPSVELQLPNEQVDQRFNIPPTLDYQVPILKANHNPPIKNVLLNYQLKPVEPTLALHLTPPKLLISKYKNPTKLYPKKYDRGFKPIPIPISQFAEDSFHEVPKAVKPLNPFKPASSGEIEYLTPYDEKKIYLYKQAEEKRKIKEAEYAKQHLGGSAEETLDVVKPTEQVASETNYEHPGRNVYPAPLRQAPPATPSSDVHAPPPAGERTEFRMHGMKGPHSYQFGYDTGKGKNRQFRYEERDNDGHVRGHYGYMDKHGKLRVVNYDAHPELGFHAEAPVEE